MAHEVFVSYSQPDRGCALELVSRLEAGRVAVWVAPRDVPVGADWAASIVEAIAGARLMILVFSRHCNDSPHVRREVERAVHRQLPVLPLRIEDVAPAGSLEYFLSAQHWLDAFPPPREPHYERLCVRVAALLGRSSGAVPVQPPATAGVEEGTRQRLSDELARYVGPVARHLVRRATAAATDWDGLCRQLAQEIAVEADRRRFLDACRTLSNPVAGK